MIEGSVLRGRAAGGGIGFMRETRPLDEGTRTFPGRKLDGITVAMVCCPSSKLPLSVGSLLG